MNNAVTELRSLAAMADDAEDTAAAVDLWRKIVSMFLHEPGVEQEPGIAYLLGYAYYQLVDVDSGAAASSKRLLLLALEQDLNDGYARLYLGHLAFDTHQYSAALEWFGSIPESHFSEHGQAWRDLKVQELKICCLAQLGKTGSLIQEFETYLLIATKCDETDIITAFELPNMLAALVQRGGGIA
ncbi:hypothetical protein EON83_30735 [bacterium]|nr:MAG: hypothetical protein EON83_30735 [bacterium]